MAQKRTRQAAALAARFSQPPEPVEAPEPERAPEPEAPIVAVAPEPVPAAAPQTDVEAERKVESAPAPIPVVEPAPTAAPKPERADKTGRRRLNAYIDNDDDARMRSAFFRLTSELGYVQLGDFIVDAVMRRVDELEKQYNGGDPFPPPARGLKAFAGRPPRLPD